MNKVQDALVEFYHYGSTMVPTDLAKELSIFLTTRLEGVPDTETKFALHPILAAAKLVLIQQGTDVIMLSLDQLSEALTAASREFS